MMINMVELGWTNTISMEIFIIMCIIVHKKYLNLWNSNKITDSFQIDFLINLMVVSAAYFLPFHSNCSDLDFLNLML